MLALLNPFRKAALYKLRLQELDVWCDLVKSKSWVERMKLSIILDNLQAKRKRLE